MEKHGVECLVRYRGEAHWYNTLSLCQGNTGGNAPQSPNEVGSQQYLLHHAAAGKRAGEWTLAATAHMKPKRRSGQMSYPSVDQLQKILTEKVFHYAKDSKKAAGRAANATSVFLIPSSPTTPDSL